jgi:hypothetical protein
MTARGLSSKLALSAPEEAPTKADRTVFLNVRVPESLRRDAHLYAVKRDMTLQQLLVRLLTRELER